MATLILAGTFIAEAIFFAACAITGSDQRKIRNIERVGVFGVFILLALASVIQWSFRWYVLTALLAVWAALGARRLTRGKTEGQPFPAWRSAGRAAGTLALVFVAVTPALIFPQFSYPAVTGSHPIATYAETYTDQSRVETFSNTGARREVTVAFWYPGDGGGPYPLVVFSHGSFSTRASNTSTFMELASHGYVVCSVDHPYHALATTSSDGRTILFNQATMQEYLDVNNRNFDEETTYQIEQKWMALRTADLNFVVDTILARTMDSGSAEVYQLIDPGKIGMMGHSLGGAASAQVARERSDIDAVINLDADLLGEYTAYANGKEVLNDTPYPVPILTIYADDMVRLISEIPDAEDVVAVRHVSATAPIAFEVHLAGTNHMSLTDLPLASPFMVLVITNSVPKAGGQEVDSLGTIEKMNGIVLTFFDAYLKGEGHFNAADLN